MIHFMFPRFRFKWERWKWNKEYRIYVSSYGNFKDEYKRNIPIKINQNGYVCIKANGQVKIAHRLVLLTYKPIPNAEELTVDHLNHNKRDNSIYNLEWVSKEENEKRAAEDYIAPEKIILKRDDHLYFKNKEEALEWGRRNVKDFINLFETRKDKNNLINTLKKRIRNAAIAGRKYCEYYWHLEDKL